VLFQAHGARPMYPLSLRSRLLVLDVLPESPRLQRVVPPHLGDVLLDAPLPLPREEDGVEAAEVDVEGAVEAVKGRVGRRDLPALAEDTAVGIAHVLPRDRRRVVDDVLEADVGEGQEGLTGERGVEDVGQADRHRVRTVVTVHR